MTAPFGSLSKEKSDNHRVWPQVITLLLALFTSVYTVWSRADLWYYAVPVVLTIAAVTLLVRDSGLPGWLKRQWSNVAVNRLARREYSNLLKFIKKASVYRELHSALQNGTTWPGTDGATQVPSFVSFYFDNWYNDIVYTAEQVRAKRQIELVLVGRRFRDFVDIFNNHYLRPFSDAMRSGRAKYMNEDTAKDVRQKKERADRLIDAYNEYCEELNGKARRLLLVPVHSMSPALDWAAAQL